MIEENEPARKLFLAGGLELTILSPGPKEVGRLRAEWESVLAEAESKKPKAADVLGTKAQSVETLAAKKFISDNKPANGSSIVLLVEYQGRRVLLAADCSRRSSLVRSEHSATQSRTGCRSAPTRSLIMAAAGTTAASYCDLPAAAIISSPPAVQLITPTTNALRGCWSRAVRGSASTRITHAAPICSGASTRSRTRYKHKLFQPEAGNGGLSLEFKKPH